MPKKGCFLPFLINILKETDFVELTSIEKRHHEWTALEDNETVQPFLDWFMNCITSENCLTTDEIALYRDLKCNDKLVPEEELDQQLQDYFKIDSLSEINKIDYSFLIAEAEKELHALTALETLLNEEEKKDGTTTKVVDQLEPFINSELKELETLNSLYNETLDNYSHAWDDLRRNITQENSKEFCSNKYLKLSFYNNQINQNISQHLKTDFQEIKLTDGKLTLDPTHYWLVYNKLSEVINDIIDKTIEIQTKKFFINCFVELEHLISINPDETSHSDIIRKFLDEASHQKDKLPKELSTILDDELNCLAKIQINDTKKCSAFLEDRIDRLSKIENILQNKRMLNDAFQFIIKRDRVVRDYQINTLNQFSKDIEVLAIQHEQRMESMKSYRNISKVPIDDPNYKAMMKCLGVQNSDYKALSIEMANFKVTLHSSFINLEESINSFHNKFTKSLNEVRKIDSFLVNGPTREMIGHMSYDYLTFLKNNLKRRQKICETLTKIQEKLEEVKNGTSKKDCIWMKCLENPKEFLRKLYEIEEETERLKERIKIELMGDSNFFSQI